MNKTIKLIAALALIGLSVYFFINGQVTPGILAVLGGLVAAFFYLINEYIALAFLRLRKQDIDGAKKWMGKITNPTAQVRKGQMGYYNYMMGITQAQDDLNAAEKYMRNALNEGLMFGHDRAMAKINLAAGMMRKGNKNEAKRLLKEAREDDKQGLMRSQIEMMEKQLKKVNVSKNPMQQQMQRRGRYY